MDVVVRINRDRFVIDAGGLTALRSAIESAVSRGGALIRVGAGESAPEALVTPASSVQIDHRAPVREEVGPMVVAASAVPPSEHLDFDAYL